MKTLLFFLTALTLQNCRTNYEYVTKTNLTSRTVRFPEYFDGIGVVLEKDAVIPAKMPQFTIRRDVDTVDLRIAENIFHQKQDSLFQLQSELKQTANFRKYNRQYFAYEKVDGGKVIGIHFIDFSSPRFALKTLGKNWFERYVVYFSETKHISIFDVFIDMETYQLLKS